MEVTVRPIRTDVDYDAALAEAARLMTAEAGTQEGDRLDVLATLIEAYEAKHWPIGSPDPIDAIKVRMEERNLKARDLEPMIGSRGRVSEVLSHKRALTLPMIRRLAKGLGLRADILIQESTPPKRPPGAANRSRAARHG